MITTVFAAQVNSSGVSPDPYMKPEATKAACYWLFTENQTFSLALLDFDLLNNH